MWHAEVWAAWAQWATAGIAGGAGWFARSQVLEARETRRAVAQPNVVVFADENPRDWHYLDFVIRNFGDTPAYSIRLTLPPLDVVPWANLHTGERVTSLYLPESVIVLAPGQEWRTMWESGHRLSDYEDRRLHSPNENLPELQSVFVGRVDYLDRDDTPHHNPIYLDTKIFWNVMRVGEEHV